MKFNVNVTYEVEAEDEEHMKQVVGSLTQQRSYAGAECKMTGFSAHKAYVSEVAIAPQAG